MPAITVITATIPGREALLREAVWSVTQQTVPVVHSVRSDWRHDGVGPIRNELIKEAKTEWVAFLDDDDMMYPYHLAELFRECDDADVIYSDCDLVEVGQDNQVIKHVKPWQTRDFVLSEIRERNYIPVTVLAKRSVLLETPFRNVKQAADWDLWIRLGEKKVRFKYVPKITWLYRRHPGNGASGGNMHQAVQLARAI